MKEVWKVVPDYSGLYEVSNKGRVRKVDAPKYVLTNSLSRYGYYSVSLKTHECKRKTVLVHRLVAFAFLGEPRNKTFMVNHIDGIKTNNTPDNLEWVLPMENVLHAQFIGLIKSRKSKLALWRDRVIFKSIRTGDNQFVVLLDEIRLYLKRNFKSLNKYLKS